MTSPAATPTTVVSSVFVSVTYTPDGTLDLVFHRGARYRYFAVPPRLVDALLAAPSKGAFFTRAIRPHFRYLRLA
jgi:hypothetical protein